MPPQTSNLKGIDPDYHSCTAVWHLKRRRGGGPYLNPIFDLGNLSGELGRCRAGFRECGGKARTNPETSRVILNAKANREGCWPAVRISPGIQLSTSMKKPSLAQIFRTKLLALFWTSPSMVGQVCELKFS